LKTKTFARGDDWFAVNRRVPRLVSVLPNGPVRVFLAGGVPEVMLHLRRLGLLALDVLTVTSRTLGAVLDEWEKWERRTRFRAILREQDGVDPDDVILPPDAARARGLTSTVTFPRGNIAPEGSVVKSTAIDPSVLDAQGVLRREGPARVFTSEHEAIAAIKKGQIQAGDMRDGMERELRLILVESEKRAAELKMLRAQMNPHFPQ
jgi:dihydroxyacid dehydratase/phosphogluconate dehydratase